MGSNLRPLVILCIDDQTSLLLARTLVLQNEGYSVLAASSAAEGLRKFREMQVDLVISDHLLGGTTGAEIAAQMKREKPEIPIILISGVSEIPMMYLTVLEQNKQGVSKMSEWASWVTFKGKERRHSVQVNTT